MTRRRGRREPLEDREWPPGSRTRFGFLLAVTIGVLVGGFSEQALGAVGSILVGVAVAVLADWVIRRRGR